MGYFIKRGLVNAIASLSLPGIYRLSDFLFFLVYKVFKYRTGLVVSNISKAFPNKSKNEIAAITEDYYRKLCDTILETLKMAKLSYEELNPYIDYHPEPVNKLFEENRNIVLALSHQFNWEWGNWPLGLESGYQIQIFYKPLTDKAMEAILNGIRSKYGTRLISVYDKLDGIRKLTSNRPTMNIFMADQNPNNLKSCAWFDFFGQKTPFQMGLEKFAIETGYPVVFLEVLRPERGMISNRFTLAFENPKETKPGEITQAYVKFIEESIRRNPSNYVWSHNRWKHSSKYPGGNGIEN